MIYDDQFNDPSFHSWNSPNNRITKNKIAAISPWIEFIILFNSGSGISSTISISKTIKIIANIKNRNENGIRALLFGSNPHSNGDVFSRSFVVRILSIFASKNTTEAIVPARRNEIIGIYITQKYYIFSFD